MPIKRPKIRKVIRQHRVIFFSLLLFILMIIAAALVYWRINKRKLIREKLETVIRKKSKGLYKISYDKLDLDEETGSLSVTNMHLEYDSAKYDALRREGTAPPILFKINIPEINVFGVKTSRAMLKNEILGQKMEIKNPSIELIYTLAGKDSSRNIPTKEVYEEILGNLNQISIDTINISGASLETKRINEGKKLIAFSNLYVQLSDVKIDSLANEDATRLLFSKKIVLQCDHFSWTTGTQQYQYRVENIFLNSETKTAFAARLFMIPQLSEQAFMKNLSVQQDRFDFALQNIAFKNIDFNRLFDERIMAGAVTVDKASFRIYRDLSLPHDRKNKLGLYPHQAFANLAIPIAVNKLLLRDAFIEYKEKNNITHKPGRVQFYHTTALLTNLVNRKYNLGKNKIMTAEITTRFLNKALFKTTWLFYMNSSNGSFDLDGHLGSIDGEDLNKLTETLGPATIKKGSINGLDFDLRGNDYSMNGNVELLYDDLKIALLEKDKGKTEWDKKSFTSFMANLFIKNSNPSGKKDPRIVQVQNTRDMYRSIFNLCWKTLFKGVKETIGIKQ